jgi:hypothetical protein
MYLVGKKNGDREQMRITADRSKNVRLSKLKYMATHRITRKKIKTAEIFQFLLMG